jgi:hypothetical protein
MSDDLTVSDSNYGHTFYTHSYTSGTCRQDCHAWRVRGEGWRL